MKARGQFPSFLGRTVPEPQLISASLDFPVVLSDESPRIYAYSLYSSVAEKFEAIVSLAYNNSRFKDFYDLYILAVNHDFNGKDLKEAVRETFANRHTSFSEIAAFETGFSEDPIRRSRWKAFVKKKRAMIPVTLEETISVIYRLLGPIAVSITDNKPADKKWDHKQQIWK